MKTAIIAFTDDGVALAQTLAQKLEDAQAFAPSDLAQSAPGITATAESVGAWAQAHFTQDEALVFIGACGIAVRAIAPLVTSKTTDPAIVVLDQMGKNVIPLLSGHLGGANDLARTIALHTNGVAVLTTGTDVQGALAVDEWARKNSCVIENPELIKDVSKAVLRKEPVGVAVTERYIPTPFPKTLWLRPRTLVLGIGFTENTPKQALDFGLEEFFAEFGISVFSLKAIATVDVKRGDGALEALGKSLNIPILFYSSDELAALPGSYTDSDFVEKTIGVGNVCERAAVKASGGSLVVPKYVYSKTATFALAQSPHWDYLPSEYEVAKAEADGEGKDISDENTWKISGTKDTSTPMSRRIAWRKLTEENIISADEKGSAITPGNDTAPLSEVLFDPEEDPTSAENKDKRALQKKKDRFTKGTRRSMGLVRNTSKYNKTQRNI